MNLAKRYNDLVKIKPRRYNPNSKPSMSPSSLGGECVRKVYYEYTRCPKEKTIPIKTARLFKIGDVIGEHLIDQFREDEELEVVDYILPSGKPQISFGKERKEFPVSNEDLCLRSGFTDMIYIEEGKLKIAEFKSIKDDGYSGIVHEPLFKHVVQVVEYFYVFNKKLRNGDYKHIKPLDGFSRLEEIHLFYYGKDQSQVKDHLISETKDVFRFIVSRVLEVSSVRDSKILPDKTQDYCNFCDYQKRCERNDLAPMDGGTI